MRIETNIYQVSAVNFMNDITFKFSSIDKEFAILIYEELLECADVKIVDMVNGVTGEVLRCNDFENETEYIAKQSAETADFFYCG